MDNGQKPATKQDVADLEKRIKQDVAEMETRLDQRFAEVKEFVQDTETKLLTAFYSFAEADQKHFIQVDRAAAAVDERLNTCERRIMEIEKRLNFPSA